MGQDLPYDEFYAEADEVLSRVSNLVTSIEGDKYTHEQMDELYRDIHTLKGTSQLFGFHAIGSVSHAVEACLEPVRKGTLFFDQAYADIVLFAVDYIQEVLQHPQKSLQQDPALNEKLKIVTSKIVAFSEKKFGAAFNLYTDEIPELNTSKIEQIDVNKIQNNQNDINVNKSREVKMEELKKPREEKSSEEQSTEVSSIRVQVGLLDQLMNLAGEMVLARNQVLQYARQREDIEFNNLTQKLDLVTTELQESIMRTRMQPIGTIFSKFQRVVRDLSRSLNKQIELTIQGADTELDKSLIEAIKDPLTHIIRNSCDHGIETPQQRKESGKKELGTLGLKAYQEGGHIIIEISDDGKGIDPERIKQKALEKNIVTAEKLEIMTIKEIQELIFAPGFSTAEQVSSVSGRGVGMDVVKTNIEKVGGMVDLESIPGKGSVTKLKIPLTLAVVPAMIVRAGQNYFAIPQVKLQELLRIDTSESKDKVEKLQDQLVYRLRGHLLPLVDLDRVLKGAEQAKDREVYNIACLKSLNETYGLIVDEICDTADIVVKPLPTFLKSLTQYSGATIMGDGTVALILDTQGVAEYGNVISKKKEIKQKDSIHEDEHALFQDSCEYVVFKLKDSCQYSIPLVLVNRLEEFAIEKIEKTGQERVVQYRKTLLPLIFLNEYLKLGETEANNDHVSVIVVSKRNKLFGLVVDEIIDIHSTAEEVIPPLKDSREILGTLVSDENKIITVVDALSIVEMAMGNMPDKLEKIQIKKASILLAEDTKFFARQVIRVIEGAGLEIDHAVDGQQALEMLCNSEKKYDLVISDIEMPRMNGFELAQNIRNNEKFSSIPLIALTTKFREVDKKQGQDVGFNRYLEKLKSDELVLAVKELLEVKK